MKVLHLLTQATGGPADHVADVAPALAARGVEVVVAAPDGPASERVERAGVRRVPLAVATKADLAGGAALLRLLRRERPDVLHCQDRRAGLAGRLAARPAGVPGVVFTLHGAPDGLAHLVPGNLRVAPERRRDRLYYLHAERALARLADRVVAPSRAIEQFLVARVGVPAGKVDVVPNGVDPDRFHPAAAAGGRVPPVAVWLGLMGDVKRLDVLVAALARTTGLAAVLAGDGPLRDDVAARVRARGLGDRVSLPGFVADPAAALRAADLFVLPSAAENCPLALLQAMACGLPVVASNVGGIPEVVRDGVDGLLVPPGDPVALAAALEALVADPAWRAALGRSARERIESGWTVAHCAAGLLGVYERVVV